MSCEDADPQNGGKVTFTPGEGIKTVVKGSYLKDYSISNEDDSSIFPMELIVIDPEEGLKVEAEVLQSGKWYTLADHKNWEPVYVKLSIDGEPLTDEQLDAAAFNIQITCGRNKKKAESLSYRIERLYGESAVKIHIGENEEGSYVAPKTGKYKMVVGVTATANTGVNLTANDKVSFVVKPISRLVAWIINLLIIIIVIIIISTILNQKVLPKNIAHVSTAFTENGDQVDGIRAKVKYSKQGSKKGKLVVSTPSQVSTNSVCSVTLTLEAIDKRIVKSKDRRVAIVGISSPNSKVSINNLEYEKDAQTGKFKDPTQPELPDGQIKPIRKLTKIINIDITTSSSSLVCTLKHE
ncbi:MAG: hypothetical protein IJD22_07890 [Clostridia bacterium]|nr:hypothetical protein [Clostridia bacterium]